MNGEYIVTPGEIYYTPKKEGELFNIDQQNIIRFGSGEPLEGFEDMSFLTDNKKNISDFFSEIGELIEEKGNLMKFKGKNGENIFIYNSKLPLFELDKDGNKTEELPNRFHYAQIYVKNKQKQITDKTEDFCKFLLDNNIAEISNVAKLKTISNKADFIKTMENDLFIKEKLKIIDEKNLEDVFLLNNNCHIGRWGKIYMYAFIEEETKLIPIIFNESELKDYEVMVGKSYDKIDLIFFLAQTEKISLFAEKLDESTIFFKEDVLLEKELQALYNDIIDINENYTKKDISDLENEDR